MFWNVSIIFLVNIMIFGILSIYFRDFELFLSHFETLSLASSISQVQTTPLHAGESRVSAPGSPDPLKTAGVQAGLSRDVLGMCTCIGAYMVQHTTIYLGKL